MPTRVEAWYMTGSEGILSAASSKMPLPIDHYPGGMCD